MFNSMWKKNNRSNFIRNPFSICQNAGLSLVELIITIAILAVVGTAIGQFVLVGLNSYKHANNEVSVQQEAQMAMNQMTDVIIDTAGSVNCYVYTAGGSFWLGPTDSGAGFDDRNIGSDGDSSDDSGEDPRYKDKYPDALGKMLILYNGKEKDDTEGSDIDKNYQNYSYEILWDNEGKYGDHSPQSLYLAKISKDDESFPVSEGAIGADGKNVKFEKLANHVTRFDVDMSQLKSKSVLKLTMEVLSDKDGDRTYSTTNNIKIRNKVAINNIAFDGDKEIEAEGEIKVKKRIVLEPGDTYTCPVNIVSGKNLNATGCDWTIVPGKGDDKGYISGGKLHINMDAVHDGAAGEGHDIKINVETKATDEEGNAIAEEIVYVDIKRATGVHVFRCEGTGDDISHEISPSVPLRISEQFYIGSEAVGDFLGEKCDGDGCAYDDPAADKDIDIWNGTRWGLVIGPNNETADESVAGNFHLDNIIGPKKIAISVANNKNLYGKKFYIQTSSALANRKGYGLVIGSALLKIESEPGITLDSDLEYGKNSFANRPTLRMKNGQTFTDSRYYVVARVSETPAVPRDFSQDKVIIYYTEGNSMAINPDIFGLDWRKQYYVSLQMVGSVKYKGNITWSVAEQDFVSQYTNPANIDEEGAFVTNNDYVASGIATYALTPPKLSFHVDGYGQYYVGNYSIRNINFGSDNSKEEHFYSYAHIDGMKPASGEKSLIFYKIYKKDQGDGDNWTLVADAATNLKTNEIKKINNLQFVNYAGNEPFYKYDKNNLTTSDCVGEYKAIPWICYRHLQPGDHNDLTDKMFYKNFTPDYTTIFKQEFPNNSVSFKVLGPTVLDMWVPYSKDGSTRFGMKSFLFIVPTSPDFTKYFDKNVSKVQECKYTPITLTAKPTGEKVTFSRVTCQYYSYDGSYVLKFYYKYTDKNKVTKEVYAGAYSWKEGDFWNKIEMGTYDSILSKGGTIVF